mgnify:CR=1 FL=1
MSSARVTGGRGKCLRQKGAECVGPSEVSFDCLLLTIDKKAIMKTGGKV